MNSFIVIKRKHKSNLSTQLCEAKSAFQVNFTVKNILFHMNQRG